MQVHEHNSRWVRFKKDLYTLYVHTEVTESLNAVYEYDSNILASIVLWVTSITHVPLHNDTDQYDMNAPYYTR